MIALLNLKGLHAYSSDFCCLWHALFYSRGGSHLHKHCDDLAKMDTLGFEPRAFRMRSGCDTTTPCAQYKTASTKLSGVFFAHVNPFSTPGQWPSTRQCEHHKEFANRCCLLTTTNNTPCGTRTRNLRIRSPTPCPLGQGGLAKCASDVTQLWCHRRKAVY